MSDSQNPVPQVTDKRPKITGLLPKNAQNRVLAGIALLMILVITFSGRKGAPPKAGSPPGQASVATDANAARIQEYRTQIDEQTRQLALEEAQLAQSKQALGLPTPPAGSLGTGGAKPVSAMAAPPEKSWSDLDREKREYQGLYASNIALSYRKLTSDIPEPAHAEAPSISKPGAPTPAMVLGNSNHRYRLFEGTIIETVLTNRLDSSFSGPVNCMVTTNVYARDHQTLLIPQGTRVLGEARKLESFGEQRLAVVFHRLIMPNDESVSLDQFKGLDQIGETGLRDLVNHHYVQIFGVSLAIGAIAGLSQATTRYNLDESAAQAYEQGVAGSLSQSSLHILDRYLNVLPTFTIREGHRIKIYLSQDLMLPAYTEHPASDL